MTKPAYTVRPFPLSRRLVIDSARAGKRRSTINALVEVDVTNARGILNEYKACTGENFSFTAFLLACFGKAIDANKHIHARRDLFGRLILFDEVDCTTMIEIELQGHKFPLAHIVHAINQRSAQSIHEEIRRVQTDPQKSASMQKNSPVLVAFLLLPAFVRDLFYELLARSPFTFKKNIGTTMVSSVGMFGTGSGWGLTPGSFYTVSLLIGGMTEKPAVVAGQTPAGDGQVMVREMLNLTVSFDHDIVDGAPAARFVERFKNLIESADGLEDLKRND